MSIKKNTIWSFVGSIAPMLIGIISIPFIIKNIGVEKFGILTLVWALIGYFSIFDFGIGRALTYQVSQSLSNNSQKNIPSIVKSGLSFMLFTGILGGIGLAIAAKPLGYIWLNVSSRFMDEAFKSIFIASIGIPLTTVTTGLKGIMEGYENFRQTNLLKIILGVLNFGFPVLSVIFLGPSLIYIVISLVIARLLILLGHIIVINHQISILEIHQFKSATSAEKLTMFKFGAWMTLSNIIGPLMVNADRFIISNVLGASLIAYYTVPFDVIIRLLVIPASLTGVLFPRFSSLLVNNVDEAIILLKKSKKIIFIVMLIVSISLILFSKLALKLWINTEFSEKSYLIACFLSIGLFFNSLAQLPHSVIQATGKIKYTSLIHCFEFIFYVPLLYLSLKYYGILGAAVVFDIRIIFDYLILTYYSNKLLYLNK